MASERVDHGSAWSRRALGPWGEGEGEGWGEGVGVTILSRTRVVALSTRAGGSERGGDGLASAVKSPSVVKSSSLEANAVRGESGVQGVASSDEEATLPTILASPSPSGASSTGCVSRVCLCE